MGSRFSFLQRSLVRLVVFAFILLSFGFALPSAVAQDNGYHRSFDDLNTWKSEIDLSGHSEGQVTYDIEAVEELLKTDEEFAEDYPDLEKNAEDAKDGKKKLPVLILYRTKCTETCTLGELYMDGKRICYTLELPEGTNQQNTHCIPTGSYACTPYNSQRFPNVYEVTRVPNRSYILFHAGNSTKDTKGCILVGLTQKDDWVGSSRKALNALRKLLGKNNFKLEIKKGDPPKPTSKPATEGNTEGSTDSGSENDSKFIGGSAG